MEVTIQCRHVDLPDSVRAAAREKVSRLSRFLDGWDHADIHFSEERNPRISAKEVCEVTLRGHGHVLRAKAAAADSMSAVDRVVDKLEHQVDKLKTRLLKRNHGRKPVTVIDGAVAVPSEVDEDEDAGSPAIVKTKRFEIKPMTPDEAALQMDLLGHDFFFFTNADTGVAAVLYRRDDGNLGLIDAT
ncbi:MAG TPA: ribosome-associated translation inhibitor RaiA [Acidimicrobiales bacterium]|nr:ribosome-associated translation inhibitor RaiA [Acidimicrobiales bacterium]